MFGGCWGQGAGVMTCCRSYNGLGAYPSTVHRPPTKGRTSENGSILCFLVWGSQVGFSGMETANPSPYGGAPCWVLCGRLGPRALSFSLGRGRWRPRPDLRCCLGAGVHEPQGVTTCLGRLGPFGDLPRVRIPQGRPTTHVVHASRFCGLFCLGRFGFGPFGTL